MMTPGRSSRCQRPLYREEPEDVSPIDAAAEAVVARIARGAAVATLTTDELDVSQRDAPEPDAPAPTPSTAQRRVPISFGNVSTPAQPLQASGSGDDTTQRTNSTFANSRWQHSEASYEMRRQQDEFKALEMRLSLEKMKASNLAAEERLLDKQRRLKTPHNASLQSSKPQVRVPKALCYLMLSLLRS